MVRNSSLVFVFSTGPVIIGITKGEPPETDSTYPRAMEKSKKRREAKDTAGCGQG